MGKKSSAKQSKAAKAAASKSDAPPGADKAPADKCPASADADSPASAATNWLDSLSPQERKVEEEKMKKRAEAAVASAKADAWKSVKNDEWFQQQEKVVRNKLKEERKWEKQLTQVKARASKEGIIEAEDWGDGVWWINLGGKQAQYLEASGQYYCKLCSKHLNDGTLEPHMESEAHKRKLQWETYTMGGAQPSTPAQPSAPPPPRAAAPSSATCKPCAFWGAPPAALEEWQELCQDGFNVRCIPCGKVINEAHLAKDDHVNRLEQWLYKRNLEASGYPEPEEPYVAWMPYDENDLTGERYKKCLLCSKWLQDQFSHSGSPDAPDGSKEHQKNLRNYCIPGSQWYEENVVAVRNRWHPNSRASGAAAKAKAGGPPTQAASRPLRATPAPWSKAAPAGYPEAANTPSSPIAPRWGKAAAAAAAASSAPVVERVDWYRAKDPASNKDYYYTAAGDVSWELPSNGNLVDPLPSAEIGQKDGEEDGEEEVEC